jgi:tRNA A-37 threonylcarbamoyl transferase component Bud32
MQRCPHCGEKLEFSKNPPRFCSSCGQSLRALVNEATQPYSPPTTPPRFTPNDSTPPPESVGGYRLLRPLGEGGMGTVYEGEDIATGRRVAVKLIRAEYADSRAAVERFRREGRLAGTIAHPRCVFVLAADEQAGRPYIVMELMPGLNLANLVENNGTLSPPEAVSRILDVIEGLQEAHRCGVIHRDVKPSNCFIDTDNRVKIGDFGLSKALATDGQLTKSGAFLGTLLYAAPEQIRNEVVDQQADVYSVAATLYFLLTGRAPFQAGDDAAATLARTMTDPLTPMRKRRPDLPTTLDAVVLRGLARERGKRWRNLEEFRVALLPFVPGRHSLGEVGWRVGAYLMDAVFLIAMQFVLLFFAHWVIISHWGMPASRTQQLLELAATVTCALLYFGVPESLWGCSAGKLLFRLRVRTVAHHDRLSLPRALWRTLLFILILVELSWPLRWFVMAPMIDDVRGGRASVGEQFALGLITLFEPPLATLAGCLVLASTMRRRNGYRALHDFLSGTVVIRLPRPEKPRVLFGVTSRLAQTPMPPEAPRRLGAFTVRGLLSAASGQQLMFGEDGALNRRVWLWLRSLDEDLPANRREVSRTTRPRWLASGREGKHQWDAFVASSGFLLTDALTQCHRLFWPETLPILEQLAAELTASWADGTLPGSLCLEQIWIETTGRIQLLDVPLRTPASSITDPEPERRALALLRRVTAQALEGRPRAPGEAGPVRAPLPGPAADVLRRLMAPNGFVGVREFHAALGSARERPVEITRTRRGVQLAVLALTLAGAVVGMLGLPIIVTVLSYFSALWTELSIDLARERLQTTSACDFVVLSSTPDPMLAAAGVAQENADREHLARMENLRDRSQREREAALQSCSRFTRPIVALLERVGRSTYNQDADVRKATEAESPRAQIHDLEELALEPSSQWEQFLTAWMYVLIAALWFWPMAWVFWAAATRGGLGLWFAGARIVQEDGRRAARWRCAWRALLVWSPMLALLSTSLGLELWRLIHWDDNTAALVLAAWVSWAAWWLALLLLPLFAGLALWSPSRGVHDRLAGTYLVPR